MLLDYMEMAQILHEQNRVYHDAIGARGPGATSIPWKDVDTATQLDLAELVEKACNNRLEPKPFNNNVERISTALFTGMLNVLREIQ